MDVYVVTVETGEYSNYGLTVDSAFADEAGAVEHIVRDYHGELSDMFSMGGLAWETDYEWAQRHWGDCRVDGVLFPRADDAPEWWVGFLDYPIVHRIRRMRVVGA